jgi:nitroreductase
MDAFYLDDNGYAQLKDEVEINGKKYNTTLRDKEYAKFVSKAKYVIKKQQGYYNKEDASMIQRRAMGKMLVQFRKYLRPGWNKRFGSKFGKSFWTESRDEWDKGSYVSLYKFLASPFTRHKNMDIEKAKEAHTVLGRIFGDFYNFATNMGIYWNTLDDFEKGNVKRAIAEFVYLGAVLLVGFMLKKLKPDDPDDKDFAYDLAAYETDRLMGELSMFTPVGLINQGKTIIKSPAAVQGTAIDAYKFVTSLVGYPFQSDKTRVYHTGIYSGETKLQVNTIKMIPIWNKIQQLQRINKYNKYYILFRG